MTDFIGRARPGQPPTKQPAEGVGTEEILQKDSQNHENG